MRRVFLAALFAVAIGTAQFLAVPAVQAEKEVSIGQLFIDAFEKKDPKGMEAVILKYKEGVPGEVQAMLGYALSADVGSKDEQGFILMITQKMATVYKEKTGDARLLTAVTANIQKALGAQNANEAKLGKIKEDLTKLGKGNWRVGTVKFDQEGKLKAEITLKERLTGFADRYVSFKEAQKAEEIVKKHLPDAKGRLEWSSGGVVMKVVLVE